MNVSVLLDGEESSLEFWDARVDEVNYIIQCILHQSKRIKIETNISNCVRIALNSNVIISAM